MNIKQQLDDLCAAGDLATQGEVHQRIDGSFYLQCDGKTIADMRYKNAVRDITFYIKAANSRQALKALRDLLEPIDGLDDALNHALSNGFTGCNETDAAVIFEAAKRFQAMQGGV